MPASQAGSVEVTVLGYAWTRGTACSLRGSLPEFYRHGIHVPQAAGVNLGGSHVTQFLRQREESRYCRRQPPLRRSPTGAQLLSDHRVTTAQRAKQ